MHLVGFIIRNTLYKAVRGMRGISAKLLSEDVTCSVYAEVMRVIMKYVSASLPLLFNSM